MEKEKFDLEAFPTSESAVRMLSYVSQGFYDSSYVGKWLYQVMGMEYDDVRKIIEAISDVSGDGDMGTDVSRTEMAASSAGESFLRGTKKADLSEA